MGFPGLLECPGDGPNHRSGAPLAVLGGTGTATLRVVTQGIPGPEGLIYGEYMVNIWLTIFNSG